MTVPLLSRGGRGGTIVGWTPPEEPFDFADPVVAVGVWANSTRVHRGRDEITIDFLRHVPELARRVLVSRALLSPLVAVELRDQLDAAWRRCSEWSTPDDGENG